MKGGNIFIPNYANKYVEKQIFSFFLLDPYQKNKTSVWILNLYT